ncbi:hypothetical protein KSP40_PGU002233 [Platanthera guangdongensis]|uniref:Uncharacterized protein n=1 Tax=Platanthera guangdongensis TaxID=2320717 RepID=A0ABR2M2X1_9ASPA
MKSSCWDKLPKHEGTVLSLWNNDDASVPSSINGESARTIGSAMKREFASRVQISKSSEVSCRKEVSYARENMLVLSKNLVDNFFIITVNNSK